MTYAAWAPRENRRPAITSGCTSPATPRGAGAPPIIVRGEGCRIVGRRRAAPTSTGSPGLFIVQVGHGRRELAEAAARQAAELAFFPLWSYAHPAAIDLAERLAHYAPGDLNRVFFTSGGGEAVEAAWKLAKQYFKLAGKPLKTKVISRSIAYHGTTQGALAITGVPELRAPFEPLVPGAFKVPNTNAYRAPRGPRGPRPRRSGCGPPTGSRRRSSPRAPTPWPRCSSSRCRTPAAASRPRPATSSGSARSATRHDVLLVSDEVICAFGRIGSMFACDDFGYVPDIITCAKGMTSGYSPIGAMIASDRLFEPFATGTASFLHGYTFGGHPVSAAVATGQPGHLRAGGDQRARAASSRRRSARPWRSCSTCRSSATCAARASSSASSW